jgi:hypothetical protein
MAWEGFMQASGIIHFDHEVFVGYGDRDVCLGLIV